jgi:hypothetical protein
VTVCRFDLQHFRELIDAAREGGYRFSLFNSQPQAGDLYLRHDVDLDLEAALELSALERELGVRATYFLMTTSVFYNLASPDGCRVLQQLRADGHAVGIHPDWPTLRLDERFDRLVSWHNPDPEYMRSPVDGALNVMAEPYVSNYRSDSNQHWRHGCPHEGLAQGEFEWLQLLIHPAIWVYPGETMRETMLAMLERERQRRLDQLVCDRIDLS